MWSVIVSLPISAVAAAIRGSLDPSPIPGAPPDALEVGIRLAIAVVAGLVGAWAWRLVRRSDHHAALWLRREVTDSAWDQALEDTQNANRGLAADAFLFLVQGHRSVGVAARIDARSRGRTP